MSTPVDVLAVLDKIAPYAKELDAVREAVRELIEAADALCVAMDEPDNRPFDTGPAQRFFAADARFRAALANCRPQQ